MAIKWKNKWMVIAWLFLFSYGVCNITIGVLHGKDYFLKEYFQTRLFEEQVDQFIDTLFLFEIQDLSKEEVKKLITVTNKEIEEHRQRYGSLPQQIANIKGQYEGKIQMALASKDQELANTYTAERDKKIDDITKNFQSDDYVQAKIIKEKEQKIDDFYRQIEYQRIDYIKYRKEFQYELKDTQTGKIYTNVGGLNPQDMAFIRSYPSVKYGPLSSQGYLHQLEPLLPELKPKILEGQIAVPKLAIAEEDYYSEFKKKQKLFYISLFSGIFALVVSLCLIKKIPILATIAPPSGQSYYNRIPIDVRAGIFAFSGLTTLLLLLVMGDKFPYRSDYIMELTFSIGIITLFITFTLAQASYLYHVMKEGTLKTDLTKSIIYRIGIAIHHTFLIRRIGTQIFILLAIVYALGSGLIIASFHGPLLLIYALIFLGLGVPIFLYIVRWAGYLNKIILHSSELKSGNLVADLPIMGKSPLATLALNINQLKYGVKQSQKEQARSERLKTELITNVSHDLRTPLTSIISYTELLKKPDLDTEDRNAYIEIIDRKSKRLQSLIEDLFEASKMATGNVELTKDKVDLVQLLEQALAEYSNPIDQSSLQFRVSTSEPVFYALVDGPKVWRVFDNLIGNILKYSLENTRVYITAKKTTNQIIFSFKNVTKYELGENVDELFERFKRGDTSRQAEGSGLGLAIAKSIIDLHDGSLDLKVDGDLFKVTLVLPI
ncbi:MAG TPA: histidine kinase dimerization/phospho-acceptor domain-containing protein [Bacillota bacterium]|nr:histidine kinase dimerization/phospho-acceptor domain-containing protein [Bacillota bacterium]